MVFLDANPVIYHVEQPATWGPKTSARITAFVAGGEELAVTDLVRMECLIGPLKKGDTNLANDFRTFFSSPDVRVRRRLRGWCANIPASPIVTIRHTRPGKDETQGVDREAWTVRRIG